jgi:hypothetical protein
MFDINFSDLTDLPMFKRCTKCGETKLVTEFGKNRNHKDGLQYDCKECKRKWREANREYRSEYDRRYREANREKKREHNRRYREANREKGQERGRKHYEANREKYRENNRAWKKANPEKMRAYEAKRRALKVEAKTFPSANDYVRSVYGKPCFFCGAVSDTHEHIIPLSRGGDHSEGNIVPACGSCNSSKKDKLLIEYRAPALREKHFPTGRDAQPDSHTSNTTQQER